MVANPSPFTPLAPPSEEAANNLATPCEDLATTFPPPPVANAGCVVSLSMVTTLVTGAMGCVMGVGLATDVLGAEGAGFRLAQEGVDM